MTPWCPPGRHGEESNCQINQIALILETADTNAVRSGVVVDVGIATVEEEGVGVGTIDRAAPIVAVAAHTVERTIAVVAEARQRQLQG